MPDKGAPSEFGGKVTSRHGVQPAPHVPTASERLSLVYRTGDESGLTEPDDGETFSGLVSAEKQHARAEAAGLLKKGQAWDEMQAEAQAEIDRLRAVEE